MSKTTLGDDAAPTTSRKNRNPARERERERDREKEKEKERNASGVVDEARPHADSARELT